MNKLVSRDERRDGDETRQEYDDRVLVVSEEKKKVTFREERIQ